MILPIARLIVISAITFATASAFADQFTFVCRFNSIDGQVVQQTDRNFVVDFDRRTVDGFPADITEGDITWQSPDENQSTLTTINRHTGHISATNSRGSSVIGNCAKPQKRQKPQL